MKINYRKLSKEVQEFDSNLINLVFNTTLTEPQKKAGVIGKVTIMHPAFVTRATMFEKNGIRNVQGASRLMDDGENWFNIVRLTESFRGYILDEFAKYESGTMDATPWYLKKVGNKALTMAEYIANEMDKLEEDEENFAIDDEFINKILDIKNISFATKMSDSQKKAGIIAKASVETSIGSVRGFTIFKSKFGNSLFGSPQTEDEDNEIPAYSLTSDCEAQVLSMLHNGIEDWTMEVKSETNEVPFDTEAQKQAIKEAVEGKVAVSDTEPKVKKTRKKADLFKTTK